MATKMTQSQFIKELALAAEVPNKTAKALLVAYADMAVKETKKNGVAVLPGIESRLVRVDRKARMGAANPATGETIKIAAKKVVKFRVAKAVKDAIVPPKKAEVTKERLSGSPENNEPRILCCIGAGFYIFDP